MVRQNKQKGYMKRYLHYHLRQRGAVLLLVTLFLAGVAVGSRLAAGDQGELSQTLQQLLGVHLTGEAQGFLSLMVSAFATTGILLALLFLCGFGAITQPVILFLLFFRGLGFGLIGGFLFGLGQRAAVFYYTMVLLPEMLLSILLLLSAARDALQFTQNFWAVLSPAGGRGEPSTLALQPYCFRFAVYLLLDGGAAFVTALIKTVAAALFQ